MLNEMEVETTIGAKTMDDTLVAEVVCASLGTGA